jgi:adenylate cyclase
MPDQLNGELVPVGGGDSIPLLREVLVIGRRESCDVCLRFPDISGRHCQITFHNGYWFIRDLNSTNGIKVNGTRVQEKLLHPNDEVSIGRNRRFTILYELPADRRMALDEQPEEDLLSQSLLQRAGLEKPRKDRRKAAPIDPVNVIVKKPVEEAADDH